MGNADILDALRAAGIELAEQAPDGTIIINLGIDDQAIQLGWSDPEDEDDPAGGVDWVDWTVYSAACDIEEQDGGTLGQAVNRVLAFVEPKGA